MEKVKHISQYLYYLLVLLLFSCVHQALKCRRGKQDIVLTQETASRATVLQVGPGPPAATPEPTPEPF